jgi:hypothetical protein
MSDDVGSLYAAWMKAVPEVFRMLVPAADSAAPAASRDEGDATALPFPADQIAQAMATFEGVLTQVYQAYAPQLAKGPLTSQSFDALTQTVTHAFEAMAGAASNPFAILTSAAGAPVAAAGALPGAAQLALGMERTFGGLGEAFGLGPLRQLQAAWAEMLVAGAAKQRAQLEYLALAARAFATGTAALLNELQAMAARGEQVESLLALLRLWVKAIDAPLHDTMQGGAGLDATAKVIRAATQHRQQVQKVVGIASEALHVPTRADVNEAFREIQELKRELRRLRRALPAPAPKKQVRRKGRAA